MCSVSETGRQHEAQQIEEASGDNTVSTAGATHGEGYISYLSGTKGRISDISNDLEDQLMEKK